MICCHSSRLPGEQSSSSFDSFQSISRSPETIAGPLLPSDTLLQIRRFPRTTFEAQLCPYRPMSTVSNCTLDTLFAGYEGEQAVAPRGPGTN
jgi:hypothetical protein